jgi:hypothetical protein
MQTNAKPRQLPYAVSNFEKLREEDNFFIDTTAFLRELERYKVPVFVRLRRLGKNFACRGMVGLSGLMYEACVEFDV